MSRSPLVSTLTKAATTSQPTDVTTTSSETTTTSTENGLLPPVMRDEADLMRKELHAVSLRTENREMRDSVTREQTERELQAEFVENVEYELEYLEERKAALHARINNLTCTLSKMEHENELRMARSVGNLPV